VSIQKIVKVPNPILRQKCPIITAITDEIRQTATDLIDTMRKHRALGIAAPQIGQALRLVVLNTSNVETVDGTEIVALNPILELGTSQRIAEEGCLSVPGLFKPIKRATNITVEYTDLDGQRRHLIATETFARAWQHECEHLDGILILDK